MNLHKKSLQAILLASLGFSVITIHQVIAGNDSFAKQRVKVVSKHKLTPASYKINRQKAKKGYAYSAKLATKRFKLANYPKTSFRATYKETLSVNGKKRVYYYIKSTNIKKSVAGWVWHSYLTKSSSAKRISITSKKSLESLIKSAPDLQPTSTIRSLPNSIYDKYRSVFNKEYNVGNFSDGGTFDHHTAVIYVTDSDLVQAVSYAINNWNTALGREAFTMGTKSNHTMTVGFNDGSSTDWDGYFSGSSVTINKKMFEDETYAINNLNSTPEIDQQVEAMSAQAADLLNQTNTQINTLKSNFESNYNSLVSKYNSASSSNRSSIKKQMDNLQSQYDHNVASVKQNYQTKLSKIKGDLATLLNSQKSSIEQLSRLNYWIAVITHEFGHAMGLYHTPYLDDIMYSSSSDEVDTKSVPVKYHWSKAKDNSVVPASATSTLSKRDISRAKLTLKLGYW